MVLRHSEKNGPILGQSTRRLQQRQLCRSNVKASRPGMVDGKQLPQALLPEAGAHRRTHNIVQVEVRAAEMHVWVVVAVMRLQRQPGQDQARVIRRREMAREEIKQDLLIKKAPRRGRHGHRPGRFRRVKLDAQIERPRRVRVKHGIARQKCLVDEQPGTRRRRTRRGRGHVRREQGYGKAAQSRVRKTKHAGRRG